MQFLTALIAGLFITTATAAEVKKEAAKDAPKAEVKKDKDSKK